MQQPIETERLILRPFKRGDCDQVAKLAGDKVIAAMTANIPHPYEPEMAVKWIETHDPLYQSKKGIVYAITLKGDDAIIGAVSLPRFEQGIGVLGYWLGVPYWGKGITFEASKGLLRYCKDHHGLTHLEVMHLQGNERSKSVIRKLGITFLENRTISMQGKPREVCVYKSAI